MPFLEEFDTTIELRKLRLGISRAAQNKNLAPVMDTQLPTLKRYFVKVRSQLEFQQYY
jgi:hypothetical protein